jgi:hypothetical protein
MNDLNGGGGGDNDGNNDVQVKGEYYFLNSEYLYLCYIVSVDYLKFICM